MSIPGLPVHGYQDQNPLSVARVNEHKEAEERMLRRIEALQEDGDCDPRSLKIAFTKMQEAFMWLNRAVFKPQRLTGDLP